MLNAFTRLFTYSLPSSINSANPQVIHALPHPFTHCFLQLFIHTNEHKPDIGPLINGSDKWWCSNVINRQLGEPVE